MFKGSGFLTLIRQQLELQIETGRPLSVETMGSALNVLRTCEKQMRAMEEQLSADHNPTLPENVTSLKAWRAAKLTQPNDPQRS